MQLKFTPHIMFTIIFTRGKWDLYKARAVYNNAYQFICTFWYNVAYILLGCSTTSWTLTVVSWAARCSGRPAALGLGNNVHRHPKTSLYIMLCHRTALIC